LIREFLNSDLQKCCEVFIQVFNTFPWNDKWTDKTACEYLKELIDNKKFIGYTLWDNSILVGAIFCHMKTHYKGDEIFVDELFISTEYQRKGYGSALMESIEKYARENSLRSITLLTSLGSPAFKFYEKLSYNQLNYLAFMYKRML